jgi:hypothetical protein
MTAILEALEHRHNSTMPPVQAILHTLVVLLPAGAAEHCHCLIEIDVNALCKTANR